MHTRVPAAAVVVSPLHALVAFLWLLGWYPKVKSKLLVVVTTVLFTVLERLEDYFEIMHC